MEEYIHAGKLVGCYGFSGDMIIKHSLGKKSAFKNIEALFIEETKDNYIPFFIEKAKIKNEEETFVKLEGINSKEAATKYLQKKIWLLKTDFEKMVSASSAISLLGFTVFSGTEILGQVNEVIEQPHQILLQVNFKNKEVLIPLHEQTLVKIVRRKKEIHVALPDGLLEIYL